MTTTITTATELDTLPVGSVVLTASGRVFARTGTTGFDWQAVGDPSWYTAHGILFESHGPIAVLAPLPGRTDAEVKAEALREAAFSGHFGTTAQSTLLRKAEAFERGEGR